MKNVLRLSLVAFAAISLDFTLFASGSSVPRVPRVGGKSAGASVDREMYSIGQRIFNGKAELSAAGDSSGQNTRLQSLQSRLPSKVAKKNDLTRFAGRLTDQQLQALEYFVGQRFGK